MQEGFASGIAERGYCGLAYRTQTMPPSAFSGIACADEPITIVAAGVYPLVILWWLLHAKQF